MKFTVLGTGSATPIVERRPSASVLDWGNESILLDCGEGTQFQMLKYKVKFSRLNYILITHLHGDHYYGLIGLLNTLNNIGRTEPLVLIGPKGLSEIIEVQLRYSQSFLNYAIDYYVTNPDTVEEVFENDRIKIVSVPLKHRVPCTGYVISEVGIKRKILIDKIPADFPLPFFKMLKEGLDVQDPISGKLYKAAEYTSEPDKPITVAYISDTIFDETIVPHIQGANLLYHESTFTNDLEKRAKETFHSTAAQAGIIARKAGVGRLIIGHFSSRYKHLDLLLKEAKFEFENTYLAEEGKTY